MCKTRLACVVMGLVASGVVTAESIDAEIECESMDEYYLCEARTTDGASDFAWSVTGDLTINLASGPLVSVGCDAGQTGALKLELTGPEGRGEACVSIRCGSTGTPAECPKPSQGKTTASSP